jgi:two-component system CheB/CheR fusion protein
MNKQPPTGPFPDDEEEETRNPAIDIPVIGIGASAGGLGALQQFLPAVLPDCGMAFVVVLHLDPEHHSLLADLLSHISPLPVRLIENDTAIAPNIVYVIPPNATLTLEHGRLHLEKPSPPPGHRYPIDAFLVSLAQDQAENAACVILSGTGSDGTIGLRAIKESGGLTLAQEDAEHDGMMRSAVATGLVDLVLPVEQMPAKLAEYFNHRPASSAVGAPEQVHENLADHLGEIIALLRKHTGHDFKDYKDRTIARRVERRMQLLQIADVADFVDRLQKDPRQLDLLFQDLLIGVTSFFREPLAFAALEQTVIPRLFDGRGADDTVRVWVAGCATGEEAYSIAMLLREFRPKSHNAPKLQIFASDIDEHALEVARAGRYPEAIAKDVTQARLDRFFTREDGTWRVVAELREIVLFSSHNLLRDAPFSRLDLLSCRNLLIYLNPELQNRVIPLFHYALHEDGFLFLGTSENGLLAISLTESPHPQQFLLT